MKKITAAATLLCLLYGSAALAASPIPSFDKEAVTTHPYNRTGQQDPTVEVEKEKDGLEAYRPGNTGTEENPAFFIKKITLTGFALPPEIHVGWDKKNILQDILNAYQNRSVTVAELQQLTAKVSDYARRAGYTVSQAAVPPQEINDGELEIRVYAASYDSVTLTKNTTRVADRVLKKYVGPLHSGDIITDKKLERVLNNLNDLPGVTARGILQPGSRPVTTALEIEALRRPVWNNYVFADNGGSKSSGRYRYGFHTEISNPGQQGDKLGLTGYISNKHTKNYGVNYERPVGSRGTRWGVGYSRTSYDLGRVSFFNPTGESEGFSFYGLTPVYRDKARRVTAIYGYDYRKIQDDIRFDGPLAVFNTETHKHANVLHAGLAASEYLPNRFTSASLIYWYGDIDTKETDAYYDGGYHKLTADFTHVRYWSDWNLRVEAHGQMANRDLDGSERFYLGGMNGVRAYPASETSGDYGYTATLELRRKTDVEGLEAAAFIDVGEVKRFKSGSEHRSLAGWGLGLRYSRPNDWHAQLDYAWKINGKDNISEDHNHDSRLWFQIYKMF